MLGGPFDCHSLPGNGANKPWGSTHLGSLVRVKTVRIRFLFASPKRSAQTVLGELTNLYGQAPPSEADYIVARGGDVTVLQALHGTLVIPVNSCLRCGLKASLVPWQIATRLTLCLGVSSARGV